MIILEIIIGAFGGWLFAMLGNMAWKPAVIAKGKHGTLYNKASLIGFAFAIIAWAVLPVGLISDGKGVTDITFFSGILVQIFKMAPLKLKFTKQKKSNS